MVQIARVGVPGVTTPFEVRRNLGAFGIAQKAAQQPWVVARVRQVRRLCAAGQPLAQFGKQLCQRAAQGRQLLPFGQFGPYVMIAHD